jgi:mono/diheme cytochrome c family protein
MKGRYLVGATCVAWGLGCGGDAEAPVAVAPAETVGIPIPAEDQRMGDALAGYRALVHEGYVGCGIPYDAYTMFFGPAPEEDRLPGREGANATMPYFYNVATMTSGVDVVAPNCLTCHASRIGDELVVGLGDTFSDYTGDQSELVDLAGNFITDPAQRAEWQKFAQRVNAIAPVTQTATVGVNPAENITAVLIAHRDQATLAWSEEPLLPLPPPEVVPADVPPWWRMKKKNAMFYVGAGRGDHARIMMTASALCVDTVPEAEAIDAYFPDVRAYIASLEAPPYPYAIDTTLAAAGRTVFEATCSRCHGTYGEEETYPNLLVPIDEVGTDPVLAVASTAYADDFIDWYNGSFYGELSSIEPGEGYMAPPLDGIWATAPFLHNGSVPTIEALLDSSLRPTYWTRSFDPNDFDPAALGWMHTALEAGQSAEPDEAKKKKIYDTTLFGYGNGGHFYGDVLSPDDRRAVIEYLKTL